MSIKVNFKEMWREMPNAIKTHFVLAGGEKGISAISKERLTVLG